MPKLVYTNATFLHSLCQRSHPALSLIERSRTSTGLCTRWPVLTWVVRAQTSVCWSRLSVFSGQTSADPLSSRPRLTQCQQLTETFQSMGPSLWLAPCGMGGLGPQVGIVHVADHWQKVIWRPVVKMRSWWRWKERERTPCCSGVIWQDADRLPFRASAGMEKQLCTMLFV